MLHLALAALLAGSPGTAAIAAPADGEKDVPQTEAAVGLAVSQGEEPLSFTYGHGHPDPTPFLNVWAGFGWSSIDHFYHYDDHTHETAQTTLMRGFLGAQANLFTLGATTRFSVGGQLMLGSTDIAEVGSSGWGMHSALIYAQLRGRALGMHVGYVFDLHDPDPGEPRIGPGQDAFLIGVSYDYQPAWLRTFGGIDLFRFVNHDIPFEGAGWEDPSLLVFTLGAGVSLGDWAELGVASLWRANLVVSQWDRGVNQGGMQHSLAPYLNLTPAFLPVGISVRGGFFGDYADYGFSTMGRLDIVTSQGFTVGVNLDL